MAGNSRGLVIIYTGHGKGKTSAAFGNVFRALGYGMRVLVIQFIKCPAPNSLGEYASARKHPKLSIECFGAGFAGMCGDKKPIIVHKKAAKKALLRAKRQIGSGKYDLVVLDEINCALDVHGQSLIPIKDAIDLIRSKPKHVHLILTGRKAKRELTALADIVTEMKEIKHAFNQGIPAQKGIDY